MAFWWVNHKQTRDHEVRGGYLWSPMRNANGAFNQSYQNMCRVQPGDLVFSYARGRIGAVGIVVEQAAMCPKPTEFGGIGDYWANEGWMVDVEFRSTSRPLRPREFIDIIGPLLPLKYSPLNRYGHGNQGCYLAGISDVLGHKLLGLLGLHRAVQDWSPEHRIESEPNAEVLEDLRLIDTDREIPETQRLQLAKARVGQGLFRKRVVLLDGKCRVTGVDDRRVLVASHIKPWREASNRERISGYNGLLLSPHVDALFDDHLLTFESDGQMHVHPTVSSDLLERWSIDPARKVEPFRSEQDTFLEHHRRVFAARPK